MKNISFQKLGPGNYSDHIRDILLIILFSMVFIMPCLAQNQPITIPGTVIDPKSGSSGPGSVTIQDGKIVQTDIPRAPGTEAIFLVNPVGDSRILNRKFEQVPAIATTADGSQIYVAWYSGGDAPGPGNYVTVAVSTDKGKTWMNNQLVVYPRDLSTRFFDPGLWRDKNGQINLFYGSSKNNMIWDGRGGVNAVTLKWDGSRIAYENNRRIADGVLSNKPIYIPAKDQALFPIYIDKPMSAGAYPANGAFILSQDYKTAANQINLQPFASIKLPEEIRIHDEPQLVQISANEFLGLVRTTKGIYSSRSTDGGKTWSNVEPFTAAGPTTSARFYIGKLRSGNIILVQNASTTRNNMTAFLSRDGGKTWPNKLLLDARENVSYPDLDQTTDGNIHVVFDRDRTGAKDILYTRFTENDVIQGAVANIYKIRVNR